MDIESLISQLANRVDRAIVDYCDRYMIGPEKLVEAMRYSLEAGGKRIRPALVLLSAQLCGGSLDQAMIPAVAIEMVHTFSLIHDDLPAMDNDDFRRGRPTNHKVFGDAMAILAGDGLLAFAFELIGKYFTGSADQKAKLMAELAQSTGPGGMTGGQAMDMIFGQNNWGIEQVEKIHLLKTAALIRCACRLGAISAGADDPTYNTLSEYGLKIGLAFQVIDDYLDQTASQSEMGKGVGKDAAAHKPNYVIFAGGPTAAWNRANELIRQACDELTPFGLAAKPLEALAQMILNRKS